MVLKDITLIYNHCDFTITDKTRLEPREKIKEKKEKSKEQSAKSKEQRAKSDREDYNYKVAAF